MDNNFIMARILSIEDDADIQHLVGSMLFSQGYEVHYAFNGKEGYEKILSLDPDLVLLDLMLPVLNGIDLLKKVKGNKATRQIPIIVVTAYGDEVSMLEHSVKALGAVEYIRKPLHMQELLSRIKAVLAQHPRSTWKEGEEPETAEIRKGAIRLDPKFRTIWINDRLVATLPFKRFQLLRLLLETKGPLHKEEILKKLWDDTTQVNALEKTIQRLREDLGNEENQRLQTTPDGYELLS